MTPLAPRQYVTFNLMREEYALEIQHVREIIECERVTAIPSMPPVVRGVINLRGAVVPAVDLPVKFGFPETPLGLGTYIVVLDLVWSGETVRLGLLTSELGRVIDVAANDIKPVPDFGTRIQSEYLRGVGDIEGRFVLFLDTERLLSPAELLRLTTVDDSQPLAADTSKRDAPAGGGGARPAGR
jgi:purine-binding chemotaxis protein CheW